MLVMTLVLAAVGFALLVIALMTGSVVWAWGCIAVCVTGAVLLLVSALASRKAAPVAGAPDAPAPDAPGSDFPRPDRGDRVERDWTKGDRAESDRAATSPDDAAEDERNGSGGAGDPGRNPAEG